MRKTSIALIVMGLISVLACSGTSNGTGGTAADGFFARYPTAFCDWAIGCGLTAQADRSSCVNDLTSELAPYRGCAAASAFYDAHRVELDACVGGSNKADCAKEDNFCPAATSFNTSSCAQSTSSSSSSSSSTSSGGSSGSTGGCDGKPEGAYKCITTGPAQCTGGAWVAAGGCCSVKVGDPRKSAYYATCKIIIGKTDAVECSYAGVQCKACLPGEACQTTCTKCASSTSSNCCP